MSSHLWRQQSTSMGRVLWCYRATPQESLVEIGNNNSCQKGWGDHSESHLRKGLKSTQSKGSLLPPLPSPWMREVQVVSWSEQRSVTSTWAHVIQFKPNHLQWTVGSSESWTHSGFNVTESHPNQHGNTILASRSHTSWWKKFCTS